MVDGVVLVVVVVVVVAVVVVMIGGTASVGSVGYTRQGSIIDCCCSSAVVDVRRADLARPALRRQREDLPPGIRRRRTPCAMFTCPRTRRCAHSSASRRAAASTLSQVCSAVSRNISSWNGEGRRHSTGSVVTRSDGAISSKLIISDGVGRT